MRSVREGEEGYVALNDTVIEMAPPGEPVVPSAPPAEPVSVEGVPNSLHVPLLPPEGAVAITVVDSASTEGKVEKKEEDIDLESSVKKRLMDRSNFRTLNTQTRTDIMEAIQIEMSALKDFPVDQLANALRHLILKNPELRGQMERGNGRGVFSIPTAEWDRTFGQGISGIGNSIGSINCFDNPCLFLDGGEAAGEAILCLCVLASLCCGIWATARPGVSTCSSAESSTTKAMKLLLPIALAVTVVLMMYRHLSESLGDWAQNKNWSRQTGEIGVPILSGWVLYLLIACPTAAIECVDKSKEKKEEEMLQAYFAEHPVDPVTLEAVTSSNIEQLLVKYKRQGDSNALVRSFSREVLNEWVIRLEALQKTLVISDGPKEECMEPACPAAKI